MVLVSELPPEEIEKHETLIRSFSKTVRNAQHTSIQLIGYGNEKGVYKVKFDGEPFVAVAAARKRVRELLTEYTLLNRLHDGVPHLVPNPIAHYREPVSEQDLILMEYLPHIDINMFRMSTEVPDRDRKLAYEIGLAVGFAHATTGLYSTEPHDGNILARVRPDAPDQIEVKMVDAIQFREGTLEEAAGAVLVNRLERPECFRFIHRFRDGLADVLTDLQGMSKDEAFTHLKFLNKYNNIL